MILFHARARRGLGHLSRAALIGEGILRLRPEARVVLACEHEVPEGILDPRIEVRHDCSGVAELLALSPDVLVFDTLLPEGAEMLAHAGPTARLVFIDRERRPDAPALSLSRRFDLVLVPHLVAEATSTFPGAIHVGPITRAPRRPPVRVPRARPLWISTAGGGGHRPIAEAFLRLVAEADARLRDRGLDFQHLVVPGPRFEGLVPEGKFETVRTIPRLVDELETADVVVSRAGYNTVHELLQCSTPFVLVPGDPGIDDQTTRARRLAGRAEVAVQESFDPETLAVTVEEWLRHPRRRSEASSELGEGALLAAAEILELERRAIADERRPLGPSDDELSGWDGDLGSQEGAARTRQNVSAVSARPSPQANPSPKFVRCAFEGRAGRAPLHRVKRAGAPESSPTLIVKRIAPHLFPRVARKMEAMEQLRSLRPHLPLATFRKAHESSASLAFDEARGVRLDQLFSRGESATSLAACARALAELHRIEPPSNSEFDRLTREFLWASLLPAPESLAPELAEMARRVRVELETREDPAQRRAHLVHRDLHARQVFVDGAAVTFVDWDLAGVGHPALDLANFEIHVHHRHPSVVPHLSTSFFRTYLEADGAAADPESMHFYRAFTRIRLGVKALRERGDSEEAERQFRFAQAEVAR